MGHCWQLLSCSVALLAGCISAGHLPPALSDYDTEPLQAPPDPPGMARAAIVQAVYTQPLPRQVAALHLARKSVEADINGKETNLALARCALFTSALFSDKEIVHSLAREGHAASMRADPEGTDPLVTYYRAVHFGLMLRQQGLTAVGQLPELEKLLKTACLQPQTDEGGPLRALGMLYLKAPAWPKGIGDLDLALEHLKKAADDFPSHPVNHLFYAQALREDGSHRKAEEHLHRCLDLIRSGNWGGFGPHWQREAESILNK